MYSFTRRRGTADRHMDMGTAASGLSEAIPQGYIHQSSHKRQVQRLSFRHRQAGTGTLPQVHRGHETSTRHNRTAKG